MRRPSPAPNLASRGALIALALSLFLNLSPTPSCADDGAGASNQAKPLGGFDYSARYFVRSYPFGFIFIGKLAYGRVLWGDNPYAARDEGRVAWKYGYVRPYATLSTALLLNRLDVGVEIHPISLVGIVVGGNVENRLLTSSSQVNCATTACAGWITRPFVRAQGVAGYAGFFLNVSAQLEWLNATPSNMPFFDFVSGLVGAAGADQTFQVTTTLGKLLTPAWSVAIYHSHAAMLVLPGSRDFAYGLATYRLGDWAFSAGAGFFTSSINAFGFSAGAIVSWSGRRSLALAD